MSFCRARDGWKKASTAGAAGGGRSPEEKKTIVDRAKDPRIPMAIFVLLEGQQRRVGRFSNANSSSVAHEGRLKSKLAWTGVEAEEVGMTQNAA